MDNRSRPAPAAWEGIQVIIPAFNEEETLGGVLRRLRAQGATRIRVIDNGSTDATAAVAREHGAEVVHEPRRGYGQACFAGCENLPESIEWILFCDADGSDDLEALPDFIRAMPESDFILGNRRADIDSARNLTPVQAFGNRLSAGILRLLYGVRYHDLGPLRAVRLSAYRNMEMQDRGFGWTVEMQARAAEMKLRIRELPVRCLERAGGVSKISGTIRGSFNAGAIILSTLAKFILRRLQPALMIAGTALLLIGAAIMCQHADFSAGNQVPFFLVGAGIASVGWLIILGLPGWPRTGLLLFWGIAIAGRLLLLPAEPGTDIWRYIWEGSVHNAGFNPYVLPPDAPELAPLRTEWWPLINHPGISAAYPPLVQIVFSSLAWIAPSVLAFKLLITAADLAICALLAMKFGPVRARIYAWCPLVLYSFAGGGHYDSLLILPMVAAWLAWEDRKRQTPLLIGLSFAIKYVTAPIAAFMGWRLLREQGLRSAVIFSALFLLPFAAGLLWFYLRFGPHAIVPIGFGTIARSAEFVPHYLTDALPILGYTNLVFVLAFGVATIVLIFLSREIVEFSEDYFFLLFLLSPVIHPWYFLWALPFAVASRNIGFIAVAVSSFSYFQLEARQAEGTSLWVQTEPERLVMWVPLILGFLYSRWKTPVEEPRCRPHLQGANP